jgi:hypothetical protein
MPNENINTNGFNESIQEQIENVKSMQNMQNSSGIPTNMKITSWILFFISIIFSVLLI